MSPNVVHNTKIKVCELCKNGDSIFKNFINELENDPNLFSHLARALKTVEDSSNLIRLPKKRFRQLKGHGLNCKLYEAKYSELRIYLFHEEKTGRVIVTGGKKPNQKADIKSVVKTIRDYRNEQAKEL